MARRLPGPARWRGAGRGAMVSAREGDEQHSRHGRHARLRAGRAGSERARLSRPLGGPGLRHRLYGRGRAGFLGRPEAPRPGAHGQRALSRIELLYERWMSALETLAVELGAITPVELADGRPARDGFRARSTSWRPSGSRRRCARAAPSAARATSRPASPPARRCARSTRTRPAIPACPATRATIWARCCATTACSFSPTALPGEETRRPPACLRRALRGARAVGAGIGPGARRAS